tara:strand:+ start:1486 stop:2778 length:1293 start_codon:yes stop_codon:yes gene_type:complete
MANNRDLLKEAIADAKSVKETAIANAKLALEEAFTPYLQDQLSAKLQEMDDEDDKDVKESEEEVKEMDAPSFERKNSPAGDSLKDLAPRKVGQSTVQEDEVDEEIDLDELLAELELDENARTDAEEEGYKDGMKDEKADLKEDERTDAEEEGYLDGEKDEKEDMDDEEIDLEDMSEDDLKGFIEDVIKDMVESGEIEPGEEFEDVEVEDEDVDVEVEDEDVEVDVELDEGMSNPVMRKGLKGDNKAEKETEKMREGELDEMGDATVDSAARGLENIISSLKKLSKAAGPAAKKAYAALQALGAGAGAAMRNEEEYLDEVEELKKELQEVNLLNAKLLYTNRIFKAKNLTESKKVKVLKAFDKAMDVKQAKTIYETLNEGIVNTITNSKINESVKRGAASKASGLEPKATKQPILESNEVYDRMRKLAGLI